MIVSCDDAGTEDVFNGRDTRNARRACPQAIWSVPRRKLDMLDSVTSIGDLRVPAGNRLERLSEDRRRQHSVRVNNRKLICFVWTDAGPDKVEITDYH